MLIEIKDVRLWMNIIIINLNLKILNNTLYNIYVVIYININPFI